MTRACPACHAKCDDEPLRAFGHREAAQHFVLAEEFPERHAQLAEHIRQLWGGSRCELLACKGCGLQFAWPFVAGGGEFYNLAYPHSDYPTQRWEFEQTVTALQRQPLGPGKVIEIGSGFGHFLCQISPRLVATRDVIAIEYNDRARQQLQALGFTAHAQDVRSAALAAYRGQVVALFMFQVLEHMDGLDRLLQRVGELLRPGAQIFIAVPNIRRIDYNETQGALLDMPPNHISRWTRGAFEAMACRQGWELLDLRTEPMSWRGFIKRDLVYSHMRRAQRSGSLANRVRAHRRTPLRLAAEGALASLAAPSRALRWALAASRGVALGESVWVHLRAGAAAP